jgi:hypothetical protein
MAGQGRRIVVAALVVALVIGAARPAVAEEEAQRYATDFGVGVGAVFTNILYMPTKFVYATFGGITGGLAYLLTGFRYDLAREIWRPSLGGTYVVTPSMLRGEERIYFSGTTQPRRSGSDEEDLPAKRDDDGY